jgi:hypothetical protein
VQSEQSFNPNNMRRYFAGIATSANFDEHFLKYNSSESTSDYVETLSMNISNIINKVF